MEKLKFLALADKHGKIERIDLGGLIVLETAFQLKNELVAIENNLCDNVIITIFELEELDLAGVQLLVAFVRKMDQMKINYQFNWNIEEEQKALFTNVGLGVELFINN
jgi:anti-anti-sigma regulatory factor